jgi:hypothetical protein
MLHATPKRSKNANLFYTRSIHTTIQEFIVSQLREEATLASNYSGRLDVLCNCLKTRGKGSHSTQASVRFSGRNGTGRASDGSVG